MSQTAALNAPLMALLASFGITHFEVTDTHHGNSHRGPLKKLIVFDRFIPDSQAFALLGYALVFRESEPTHPL